MGENNTPTALKGCGVKISSAIQGYVNMGLMVFHIKNKSIFTQPDDCKNADVVCTFQYFQEIIIKPGLYVFKSMLLSKFIANSLVKYPFQGLIAAWQYNYTCATTESVGFMYFTNFEMFWKSFSTILVTFMCYENNNNNK